MSEVSITFERKPTQADGYLVSLQNFEEIGKLIGADAISVENYGPDAFIAYYWNQKEHSIRVKLGEWVISEYPDELVESHGNWWRRATEEYLKNYFYLRPGAVRGGIKFDERHD